MSMRTCDAAREEEVGKWRQLWVAEARKREKEVESMMMHIVALCYGQSGPAAGPASLTGHDDDDEEGMKYERMLRAMRNAVIGNTQQKERFVLAGAVEAIIDLLHFLLPYETNGLMSASLLYRNGRREECVPAIRDIDEDGSLRREFEKECAQADAYIEHCIAIIGSFLSSRQGHVRVLNSAVVADLFVALSRIDSKPTNPLEVLEGTNAHHMSKRRLVALRALKTLLRDCASLRASFGETNAWSGTPLDPLEIKQAFFFEDMAVVQTVLSFTEHPSAEVAEIVPLYIAACCSRSEFTRKKAQDQLYNVRHTHTHACFIVSRAMMMTMIMHT